MISYRPLSEWLKKTGTAMEDIAYETGIPLGILRAKLNNTEYVPMEYIDRICGAFGLKVEEVMEWSEGEQKELERKHPDWELIGELMKKKRLNIYRLSIKCQLNHNTLWMSRTRGGELHISTIRDIARILDVEPENIIRSADESYCN